MRHDDVTVATKPAPRKKSRTGRPLSKLSVMQLTLMDAQIASISLKDAVRKAVVKKRISIRADVAVQLSLDDRTLRAALEDAIAKKRASIVADIEVHNALIQHVVLVRKLNAAIAA